MTHKALSKPLTTAWSEAFFMVICEKIYYITLHDTLWQRSHGYKTVGETVDYVLTDNRKGDHNDARRDLRG